jgi:hypothetical protein
MLRLPAPLAFGSEFQKLTPNYRRVSGGSYLVAGGDAAPRCCAASGAFLQRVVRTQSAGGDAAPRRVATSGGLLAGISWAAAPPQARGARRGPDQGRRGPWSNKKQRSDADVEQLSEVTHPHCVMGWVT